MPIDDGFEALLEPFYNGKKLTDPISTVEDKMQLLPAFLKVKGLVKQHIDSYNFFVDHEIKEIVKANRIVRSDVNPSFFIEFLDIRVVMPDRPGFNDDEQRTSKTNHITPMECRLRDMTYSANILVDVAYLREKQRVVRKDVELARIPVMLRSNKCHLYGANNARMELMNECPLDPGGYFIVGGTEKVILVQEQLNKNRVIVEADEKNGVMQASVTSSTHERKSKTYIILKKDRIHLNHNVLTEPIPIIIILKAMGCMSDYDIMHLVAGSDGRFQDDFVVNFEEASKVGVSTQDDALDYVGARVKMGGRGKPSTGKQQSRRNHAEEALDALSNIIIAHIPVEGVGFEPKAIYMALMTRRVLMAHYNPKLVDDRDFVGNKRLELAGQLLSLLFEDLFKKYLNDLKFAADNVLKKNNRAQYDPMGSIVGRGRHIGDGMNRAIQTGNWSVKRFKMERAGVTHVLSRLSYISALGMMTRISSQFEKTRKVSGPRALQPSQWGMLCTSDTPEGEACGLVKNLALMTHITTNIDEQPVTEWTLSQDESDTVRFFSGGEMHKPDTYIIYINGTPTAYTHDANLFASKFRTLRRRGVFSPFVSINVNAHLAAVNIATDEGRICRPYIIVKNGKARIEERHLRLLQSGEATFDDFLTEGVVEYLDVNEENDTLIALYEKDITKAHTHVEIEPFTILGAVAGLIPFPHHNQSPRNTYQCAMGKQAIGAIAYNQFNRIDTLLYTLVYPQRPMVITKTIELIHYDKLPAGHNATVAVMSFSGYDIEDALVLNKASCDRGFGRCQVFRKYTTELQRYPTGARERIGEKDPAQATSKHIALSKDGIADVGWRLESDNVMLRKQTPVNTMPDPQGQVHVAEEYRETPLSYRTHDSAYVDKVMITQKENQSTLLKIQTRQTRRPEVGDKFSSRHGQKGVVGYIVDQEDMPFADNGLVPDIIMNPHGFPSRMTVGKLLECLTGKAAVVKGRKDFGYGDAFRSHPLEEMSAELVDAGFSWEGKDYFTSGITGEPLKAYIFNGPIYYQRLKHMVQDKMHSRSRGPRAILTRQPTEGRSREGGLRLGEMERDCLIAYGASQLLLERLMLSSDATEVDICQHCGLFGYKRYCNTCRTGREVARMTMPYAAKLLIQELISMNVGVRLQLEDEFPHPK